MLNFFKTDDKGKVTMDPDFIYFINMHKTQFKESDKPLFDLLGFIVWHREENSLAMLNEKQKALFEEKITKVFVTTETCDICHGNFSWKDNIFKQYRDRNGQRVPYHPYCLQRESHHGSYKSDF